MFRMGKSRSETSMGIREKGFTKGFVGYGLAAVLLIYAIGMLTYQLKPEKRPNPFGAFYTDDDGKSYFTDTIYKFPPFDHDGKTAVMAYVYSSDHGNFVGILQRYTPDAKKKLEDAYAKVQAGQLNVSTVNSLLSSNPIRYGGTEVKLVGSDHWVPRAQMMRPDVKAPDGSPCYPVLP
jgi:hypothetical protein